MNLLTWHVAQSSAVAESLVILVKTKKRHQTSQTRAKWNQLSTPERQTLQKCVEILRNAADSQKDNVKKCKHLSLFALW